MPESATGSAKGFRLRFPFLWLTSAWSHLPSSALCVFADGSNVQTNTTQKREKPRPSP
jgi:hypothetical protein